MTATARVRGIAADSYAGMIRLCPDLRQDGSTALLRDRHGGGWTSATLAVDGPRGSLIAWLGLTPSGLRALARKAERVADFLDERSAGRPGPCLCVAWSHNVNPCQNAAKTDDASAMCAECHPPGGQSTLDSSHGTRDDRHASDLASRG